MKKKAKETSSAPRTATGYVRVSTSEQPNSVSVQTLAINRLALAHGYTLDGIHLDVGVSGSTDMEKRKGGALALAAGTDCLIVSRFDRCFRNARNALNCLEELKGKGRAFLSEEIPDTSTIVGKLVFTILGAVAEVERGFIAERIRETAAKRRAAGEPIGHLNFGFRLLEGKLVPLEAEQVILQEIRKAIKAGKSLCSIARDLTERGVPTKRGGRTWYASSLQSILGIA